MAKLKLGVFDIDGTLRTIKSPWTHLHQHLGLAEQGKKHFQWYHEGKIDYKKWVELDAGLWKGFHRSQILESLETNPLRSGAAELLGWFRARQIPIIGISTGLDVFNRGIEQQFDFHVMHSNELLFDGNDICRGEANIHVREDGKGGVLRSALRKLNIEPESVVAFGDGTADMQLFEIAGLSIAISPSKDEVGEAADHVLVEHQRIDTALEHVRGHFEIGEDI